MNFRTTVRRAAGMAALSTLLASCGGSSNGLVPFNPARVLVFGDQASVITLEPVPSEGRKYTINAVNADGTFNCLANKIWIQVLATSGYGIGFPECPNGTGSAATAGRIQAKPGATAGGALDIDLAGQITEQLNKAAADGGGISSSDLVTVFIGVNDVVEAFKRYEDGASADDVKAQAGAAGVAIAEQVARIADAGGRVIVATVPDVGVTPYGLSKLLTGGNALLTALTLRVNNQFLVTLQNSGNNNGRKIGLIEINPYVINVVANPAAYGYVNVRDGACQVIPLPPLCTTSTLKTNTDGTSAGSFTWLWANELQLSPGGHAQLGSLASTRAHNQPF